MIKLILGDASEVLKSFEKESINCVVTSPPYWRLRDYGDPRQIGLEETPEKFINNLCNIFDKVYQILKSGKSKSGMRENREWLATVTDKGRNMRAVWKIGTVGIKEAHFSTFPIELAKRCIEAGCPDDGTVLDIFSGAGTTNIAAKSLGIKSIGIELVEDNIKIAKTRIEKM